MILVFPLKYLDTMTLIGIFKLKISLYLKKTSNHTVIKYYELYKDMENMDCMTTEISVCIDSQPL